MSTKKYTKKSEDYKKVDIPVLKVDPAETTKVPVVVKTTEVEELIKPKSVRKPIVVEELILKPKYNVEVILTSSGIEIKVPLEVGTRIEVTDLIGKIHLARTKIGYVTRTLLLVSGVRVTVPGVVEYVPGEKVLVLTIAVKLSAAEIKALKGSVKEVLTKVS